MTERRACAVVGAWRSTVRYRSRREEPPEQIEMMRVLAAKFARSGDRRLHVVMVRQGWRVNHKRFYRLYRREGPTGRRRKRKRRGHDCRYQHQRESTKPGRWITPTTSLRAAGACAP